MKTFIQSKSQRQAALISGIAIVIMTIAAIIANDGTINRLIIENNATETFKNILASKTTFNIGVLSWLIILISDVFAAWGLYLFFKHFDKNLSLITGWLRLVYAAMLGASIFNLIYVYLIVNQPGISTVDITDQLSEKVMFYISAFNLMFSVSLIVFGIHILLVGYLSVKTEYIPKILGVILMLAFVGYIVPNISNLILPEYKDFMRIIQMIFLIPMLGEVALGIWLLILGLRKNEIN